MLWDVDNHCNLSAVFYLFAYNYTTWRLFFQHNFIKILHFLKSYDIIEKFGHIIFKINIYGDWYIVDIIEINIGDTLSALRKEMGMTQEELGQKLGLDKTTISAYESDIRQPTAVVAAKIAKSLNVSLDYLCGITPEKYELQIASDVNFDMSKLSSMALKSLCEYYNFLAANR